MINKYFYNLSVTITGIITAIFILTTVGGLFHIPVNPFYVFIPFVGGVFYLKKQSNENIDFLKQMLILMLIIMFSYFLAISVWDCSWDGRSSHIATVILLKKGWLPIYDNYKTFAETCNVYPQVAFWGNCYLRFTEVIGANIYKLTDLIESAKTVNFIMLFSVFMYSFCVLSIEKKNIVFPFLSAFVVTFNPVCIYQWFTNYIDLHIYFSFTLLILTIVKIEFQKNAGKTDLFVFVCSSIMLAMTKFTGSMYLSIIVFLYFIYLVILKREIKNYVKIIGVTGLLLILTGISPFYTNFRDFEHPFYPLFGQNKINISSENIPYSFKEKNNAERFFISTFSETLNSVDDSVEKIEIMKITPKLKIPFTINKESIFNCFYCADMRIGGFGYFWSGILLLSLIYLPFIRFRNKNEKNIFWLITTLILCTTFANPHSWWARYVPQLWLFPIFIFIFGLLQEDFANNLSKKVKNFVLYSIIIVCVLNSWIVVEQNTDFNLRLTKYLKAPYNYIDSIKSKNSKIYLMKLPEWENMEIADETIHPHLEEFYGKENIIDVSYDEKKIFLGEFIPFQKQAYVVNRPCYFFKIEE